MRVKKIQSQWMFSILDENWMIGFSLFRTGKTYGIVLGIVSIFVTLE